MKNKNDKNEDKLITTVIEKEKKNNKLVLILSLIIVILLIVLIYLVIDKENMSKEKECSYNTIKEVEVDPKYQLINYNGFRFKMPLEWDFVSTDTKYEIADKEEKVFITFSSIDMDYESFRAVEFQRQFLELTQTAGDVKIDSSEEKEKDNKKYYLYIGTNNSYNYIMVAVGNNTKSILVKAQFIDKIAYNDLEDKIIDFALTAI